MKKKSIIILLLLLLIYIPPAEALTVVDIDKDGKTIFREPQTFSEVLTAIKSEGYPVSA